MEKYGPIIDIHGTIDVVKKALLHLGYEVEIINDADVNNLYISKGSSRQHLLHWGREPDGQICMVPISDELEFEPFDSRDVRDIRAKILSWLEEGLIRI